MNSLEEKMASIDNADIADHNKDLYSYSTDLRGLLDRWYEMLGAGRVYFGNVGDKKPATIEEICDFISSYKKFDDACNTILGYGNELLKLELADSIASVRTVIGNKMDSILASSTLNHIDFQLVFERIDASAQTAELWSKLQDEIGRVEKRMWPIRSYA